MQKRRAAAHSSERRSSDTGRGQSGLARAARPLHLDVGLDKVPESVRALLSKAKTKWLANSEVFDVLKSHKSYGFRVSQEAPVQPPGGSLFLFNRNFLRFFRKDSHNWRKKADGKSVRETHEKLKVGSSAALNCYYAHTAEDTLQRRCYWLLDNDEGVVLVHYLNVLAGSSKTNSYRPVQRASLGQVTDGAVSQESQSGHFDKEESEPQLDSKSCQSLEDKKAGLRTKHTSKASACSASTRATAVTDASPSTVNSKRRRSISLNAGFNAALEASLEAQVKQEMEAHVKQEVKSALGRAVCGPAQLQHDLGSHQAQCDMHQTHWDVSEDLQEVPSVYLEEGPQTWTACGLNSTMLPRSVSPCAVTSSCEEQQMLMMQGLEYGQEPLTPTQASHSSYATEPLTPSTMSRTIFVAEAVAPARTSCSNYTAESLAPSQHHYHEAMAPSNHHYHPEPYHPEPYHSHNHMSRSLMPTASMSGASLQRQNSHAALQELLNQPEFLGPHFSRHNTGLQLDGQDMRNFGLDVARSINELFTGPADEAQTSGLVRLNPNCYRNSCTPSTNPGNVLLDVLSLTVPPLPAQLQQMPLEQVLMRHNRDEMWMLPPTKKPRMSFAANPPPSMHVDDMMWSAHLANNLSQEPSTEHNFEFWC